MFRFNRYNKFIRLFLSGILVLIFLLVQFIFRGQESHISQLFANDNIVQMIAFAEEAGNTQNIEVSSFYYSNTGKGSFYGKRFHNRKTASGERYDMHGYTAAHKSLPFGTIVRVINEDTGLKTLVKINDRGPFTRNRVIDLSRQSAEAISGLGLPNVKIEALVMPNDFDNKTDKRYYFGYSFDFPLLIALSDEIEIIDSSNSFDEAFEMYQKAIENTKITEIYLFVDFAKPYFANSEGSDYRYYIAYLGKDIPAIRRLPELSMMF